MTLSTDAIEFKKKLLEVLIRERSQYEQELDAINAPKARNVICKMINARKLAEIALNEAQTEEALAKAIKDHITKLNSVLQTMEMNIVLEEMPMLSCATRIAAMATTRSSNETTATRNSILLIRARITDYFDFSGLFGKNSLAGTPRSTTDISSAEITAAHTADDDDALTELSRKLGFPRNQ